LESLICSKFDMPRSIICNLFVWKATSMISIAVEMFFDFRDVQPFDYRDIFSKLPIFQISERTVTQKSVKVFFRQTVFRLNSGQNCSYTIDHSIRYSNLFMSNLMIYISCTSLSYLSVYGSSNVPPALLHFFCCSKFL